MKVLFDHKIFSTQKYGGASKYFSELLRHLPREVWESTTRIADNEYIKSPALFNYCDFLPSTPFKGKAFLMYWLNRPYTYWKLSQGAYDIFHQTDFDTYYLNAIKRKKMVMTFHDMNYTKYRQLYTNTLANNIDNREAFQKQSVARADVIVAVSQYTKNDLVNLWQVNPDKIVVIHHGVDKVIPTDLNKDRVIGHPYLLFVGERYGFKNFDRFLKAYAIVKKHFPDLRLICTGRTFSEEEEQRIRKLRLQGMVIQIGADEWTMARLYRDAEMFVYPSYSEGFGMPILEAMVYGCPVVLSDASCFPEVAGAAGIYFDPYQEEDMADKIERVLVDETFRKEKIILGHRQLEHFSWEKTAREHFEVYQSLM
ncbi:MAG: glycosyltransferase family 1 protein [Bacteroidota bacterium]|nr:glycosyltransferase family 1 protein [Bacteroidota bacterium]